MAIARQRETRTIPRFEVFGREVDVQRVRGAWQVFYPGADGKARVAYDLQIRAHVEEASLDQYLFDFCYEWATPRRTQVRLLNAEIDPALEIP